METRTKGSDIVEVSNQTKTITTSQEAVICVPTASVHILR